MLASLAQAAWPLRRPRPTKGTTTSSTLSSTTETREGSTWTIFVSCRKTSPLLVRFLDEFLSSCKERFFCLRFSKFRFGRRRVRSEPSAVVEQTEATPYGGGSVRLQGLSSPPVQSEDHSAQVSSPRCREEGRGGERRTQGEEGAPRQEGNEEEEETHSKGLAPADPGSEEEAQKTKKAPRGFRA